MHNFNPENLKFRTKEKINQQLLRKRLTSLIDPNFLPSFRKEVNRLIYDIADCPTAYIYLTCPLPDTDWYIYYDEELPPETIERLEEFITTLNTYKLATFELTRMDEDSRWWTARCSRNNLETLYKFDPSAQKETEETENITEKDRGENRGDDR